MEFVMTKERRSAALVIETCRVDKGFAANDARDRNGDAVGDRGYQRGKQGWASSYTKAMIDLRGDEELKDSIMVAMPKLVREGFNLCTIHFEYECKPSRCSTFKVFGHVLNECPKKIFSYVVKNLNNPGQATRGVSDGAKVNFKSTKQIYRLIYNMNGASTSGKKKQAKFLDKRNSLVPTGNVDIDSEAEVVFDEIANLMLSTSFKVGDGFIISVRADVVVPLKSIRVVREQFANSAYGFFLGKRVAYLVVSNCVRNTWSNYGMVKSMLNSSNGFFYSSLLLRMVKLHGVPMKAFSEDELNVIATILGTPLMLDSYTSDMCMKSWVGMVHKQVEKRSKLNRLDKSSRNTPIIDKIDKLECQIINGKLMFMDDDGNLLVYTSNVASESEVEVVFDETTNLMAATSSKGGNSRGYGNNSLLEQWSKTYQDDDYDPYYEYLNENHDMSEHL
nr:hypothetical protein [Tanacetum cinerariifolium]